MMRQEIIKTAREYVGTPFVHQARLKGIGVDCIGLVTGIGKDLGLINYDHVVYPRYSSNGDQLMFHMRKAFVEIDVDKRQPADVIIYWTDKNSKHPQHLAVLTDNGIIHTYDRVKKVVETPSHPTWDDRITHAFQWPGVGN